MMVYCFHTFLFPSHSPTCKGDKNQTKLVRQYSTERERQADRGKQRVTVTVVEREKEREGYIYIYLYMGKRERNYIINSIIFTS